LVSQNDRDGTFPAAIRTGKSFRQAACLLPSGDLAKTDQQCVLEFDGNFFETGQIDIKPRTLGTVGLLGGHFSPDFGKLDQMATFFIRETM